MFGTTLLLVVYVLVASHGVMVAGYLKIVDGVFVWVDDRPQWHQDLCNSYERLHHRTNECKREDIFDLKILEGDESVTRDMQRIAVAKLCSPHVFWPYIDCPRANRTDADYNCTVKERELTMAEVEQYYAQCDSTFNYPHWINDYILYGVDHVTPACFNLYQDLCVDELTELTIPDYNTSLSEALVMAKHNTHILVECNRRYMRTVIPTLAWCTTTAERAVGRLLIYVTIGDRADDSSVTNWKREMGRFSQKTVQDLLESAIKLASHDI